MAGKKLKWTNPIEGVVTYYTDHSRQVHLVNRGTKTFEVSYRGEKVNVRPPTQKVFKMLLEEGEHYTELIK